MKKGAINDPTSHVYFVDALRGALRLDPLYGKGQHDAKTDAQRFDTRVHELPAQPRR